MALQKSLLYKLYYTVKYLLLRFLSSRSFVPAKCMSTCRGSAARLPVVIGVGGSVAALDLAHAPDQQAFIHGVGLDETSLFEEVVAQQGERVARRGICQRKHVKLPTVLGILLQQPPW